MGEGQRPKHFQRPNRSQQVGLFDLFGHCKTFGSADFREGGGNISSRLGVECLHYYSGFKTLNGDTEKHKIYECIVGFFTSSTMLSARNSSGTKKQESQEVGPRIWKKLEMSVALGS